MEERDNASEKGIEMKGVRKNQEWNMAQLSKIK